MNENDAVLNKFIKPVAIIATKQIFQKSVKD